MSLKAFVAQHNKFNALWGDAPVDLATLDQKVADELFQRLDSNLSPEALTCDGELSRAKVQQRYKLYMGAIADLKKMGFQPTEKMWSI